MTVKELIKELMQFPPDMQVAALQPGMSESSLVPITKLQIKSATLRETQHVFEGDYVDLS